MFRIQTEFLAKKLGKMFGIEEVEVKTSPDTQSPSLVLGTYLSPKLYVSYGFGLIDAINTLQLRYRISGKSPFASGVLHSSWVAVGGMVVGDAGPDGWWTA